MFTRFMLARVRLGVLRSMMIYMIPKVDDKPVKIVFEDGKGSDSIVEDEQIYLIDEHPSPEEVGKALKTLYERLMSIEEEVKFKQ